MIVARSELVGDVLVLDGGLQHHSLVVLVDQIALDLLPGRLAFRIVEAAVLLQRRMEIGRASCRERV